MSSRSHSFSSNVLHSITLKRRRSLLENMAHWKLAAANLVVKKYMQVAAAKTDFSFWPQQRIYVFCWLPTLQRPLFHASKMNIYFIVTKLAETIIFNNSIRNARIPFGSIRTLYVLINNSYRLKFYLYCKQFGRDVKWLCY